MSSSFDHMRHEGGRERWGRGAFLFCAVTDRAWTGSLTLLEQMALAADGGATMIQLREKELCARDFLREAIEAQRLCNERGVPLIINDRADIAIASGADGLHVGQDDIPAKYARKLIGDCLLLGVTARTPEQARRAEADGADYLGVGAIFPSPTKGDAGVISLEALREICASVSIPVIAIGGLTAANVPSLAGTGAAGCAFVSEVFGSRCIRDTCSGLRAILERTFY